MDEQSQPSNAWKQGGGFAGLWKGTQHLGFSFLFVFCIPALIIFIVGEGLTGEFSGRKLAIFFLAFFAVTFIHRIAAWFSLIRCRNNVGNGAFTYITMIFVAVDIVRKTIYWIILVSSSVERLVG